MIIPDTILGHSYFSRYRFLKIAVITSSWDSCSICGPILGTRQKSIPNFKNCPWLKNPVGGFTTILIDVLPLIIFFFWEKGVKMYYFKESIVSNKQNKLKQWATIETRGITI